MTLIKAPSIEGALINSGEAKLKRSIQHADRGCFGRFLSWAIQHFVTFCFRQDFCMYIIKASTLDCI